MPRLVTLDYAKLYTELSSLSDAVLAPMLDTAALILEHECHRDFDKKTRTAVHDGDGTRELFLNHMPIISVTSIAVTDSAGEVTTYSTFADSFRINLETGEVRFRPDISGRFTTGFQNVTVVYVSGFETIPATIQEAVCQLAIAMKEHGLAPVMSEKLGDWQKRLSSNWQGFATLTKKAWPPQVLRIIQHYKDQLV